MTIITTTTTHLTSFGGGLLTTGLVPHQLVHGVAEVGVGVAQQVVGGHQHLEQSVEGLALDGSLGAAGVEAGHALAGLHLTLESGDKIVFVRFANRICTWQLMC